MQQPCIGLFGTCGGSQWRTPFKSAYEQSGVAYYDPQVEDWSPADAVEEARHLAEDQQIIFAITDETYAQGSLSEVGFSILNALRLDNRRDFVLYIDLEVTGSLEARPSDDRRKDSVRSRALVGEHLRQLQLPSVYLAQSLEQALDISLRLYQIEKLRQPLASFNPHRIAR